VYTEISSEYIRPGLAEIEEIGLSHDSVTDLDIGLKQGRLNDYKRRSRAGVEVMTEAVSPCSLSLDVTCSGQDADFMLETERIARRVGRSRTQKRYLFD
jgi:hypothetical protein